MGGRQPAPHQKGGAGSYICVRVRFSVHGVCVCTLVYKGQANSVGGGGEEEEEDLFVFNDGGSPPAPPQKGGTGTSAKS